MNEEIEKLLEQLQTTRAEFEMEVEVTCLEITALAKSISAAIGDVSVTEAKDVIIREFTKRLHGEFHHGEFKAKT